MKLIGINRLLGLVCTSSCILSLNAMDTLKFFKDPKSLELLDKTLKQPRPDEKIAATIYDLFPAIDERNTLIDGLQQDKINLKNALDIVKAKNTELIVTRNNLATDKQRLQTQINNLETELNGKKNEVKILQETIQFNKNDAEIAQEKIENLQKEVHKINQLLKNALNDATKIANENKEFQNIIYEQKQEIDLLQNDIDELEKKNQNIVYQPFIPKNMQESQNAFQRLFVESEEIEEIGSESEDELDETVDTTEQLDQSLVENLLKLYNACKFRLADLRGLKKQALTTISLPGFLDGITKYFDDEFHEVCKIKLATEKVLNGRMTQQTFMKNFGLDGKGSQQLLQDRLNEKVLAYLRNQKVSLQEKN